MRSMRIGAVVGFHKAEGRAPGRRGGDAEYKYQSSHTAGRSPSPTKTIELGNCKQVRQQSAVVHAIGIRSMGMQPVFCAIMLVVLLFR